MQDRASRLQISLSPALRMALDMTAAKNDLPASTQAMVLLRQSLDRTMSSEAFQSRFREARAKWTTKQRLDDLQRDREVERLYEAVKEGEGARDADREGTAEAATATNQKW